MQILVILISSSTMNITFRYYIKKNINFYFKLILIDKLLAKLKKLMIICRENHYHT